MHCYADDTQLYISAKPDTIVKQLTMEVCLKEMKQWMAHNFLLLNSGKTKSIRNKMHDISLHLDGVSVAPSAVIKNRVIFDPELSFVTDIKNTSRIAFFHLMNIAKIRKMLSVHDAEKLAFPIVSYYISSNDLKPYNVTNMQ